jgi:cell wall-associated NlpC family hydrolase
VRVLQKLLVASACVAVGAAFAACGDSSPGTAGAQISSGQKTTTLAGQATATTPTTSAAKTTPGVKPTRHHATVVRGAGAPSRDAGRAREVADPQESESFPAPAGTRHTAAAKPAEAAVAAGAPSDAEVRRELEQMQAVERSAKRARTQTLTTVAGGRSIGGSGALAIPSNVPEVIQKVIAGANEIADFPYVFGGGHASFVDNAYDCSGSVSYALAAGGLLAAPQTSGELESWGAPGPGKYITVFANAGHTYMYVDGVMYNTAGRSGVYASRWQAGAVDNSGFVARHWPGL